MPIIHVHMLEGRTQELKKKLVANMTEAVVKSLEVKPEDVRIILYGYGQKQLCRRRNHAIGEVAEIRPMSHPAILSEYAARCAKAWAARGREA